MKAGTKLMDIVNFQHRKPIETSVCNTPQKITNLQKVLKLMRLLTEGREITFKNGYTLAMTDKGRIGFVVLAIRSDKTSEEEFRVHDLTIDTFAKWCNQFTDEELFMMGECKINCASTLSIENDHGKVSKARGAYEQGTA